MRAFIERLEYFVLISFSLNGKALCCPSGWMTHGTNCYHFSHDTESWIGALYFCREYGGQLLEIQNAAENEYIKAQVKLQNKNFWIALSDAEEEGTWIWMNSKTPLSSTGFSDWAPGEPNNMGRNQNCGCFYLTPYFKWDDCLCHENHNYICEKPDGSGEIIG
ncbi:perlucin-like protein [Mercenaria mercenaria]|uniref:perlucin-like protein n=1 Tax=Mercenaria mercenaria TaxID=6596 RepID=UPI00234F3C72|nr:perlucin-like protein [Mercenaria mercenaria]